MKVPILENRRRRSVPPGLLLTFAAIAIASVLFTAPARASSVETVLHNFSGPDGRDPTYSLLRDTAGNLYGVTWIGGASNAGTVFEVSLQGNALVTNILYTFKGGTDGYQPFGRLIMDGNGNLYGVTNSGGAKGWGTVYRLSPGPNGNWTEKILWSFGHSGGYFPAGGLALDAAGNLYGTTSRGGGTNSCINGCGIVFNLSPTAKGLWKFGVLYHFLGWRQHDGQYPNGDLIFDATGNLYGTTFEGGSLSKGAASGNGTAFELSLGPTGAWTEKVIHSFLGGPSDGQYPLAGLTVDQAGNLYGTTQVGGLGNSGSVFELSPGGNGWTETVLYSFSGGSDGANPASVLALNSGNVYGTAAYGGNTLGDGVVFKLSPSGSGWTEEVLHTFTNSPDGVRPDGGVVLDDAGNIYGSTFGGGTGGRGTVYKISN